jgi:uncharacterized SAM-binding protein YcdF (DUF218 family)
MNGIPFSFSAAMPPMIFIVLALLGTLAGLRWRWFGAVIAIPSVLLLYACSTPLVSSWLLAMSAAAPVPTTTASSDAQAIVLLAADAQGGRLPSEPDWPGPLTLERMVKTAALHRETGLPILVTGGPIPDSNGTYAETIAATLKSAFNIEVRWQEKRSRNTFENAAFSASILKHEGVAKVLLVAQDWDMPRALWAFERAGMNAVPGAAGRTSVGPHDLEPSDFFPSPRGFHDSFYALHEIMGLRYYRWRFGS